MASTMKRSSRFALLAALCAAGGCLAPDEDQNLVPPTADEDDNLPRTRVQVAGNDVAIHLETMGDPANPALFVMHGSLADFRALRPFEALADDYYVVMWDQRGNGLSQRIDESEISDEAMVEEIDAVKAQYSPDAPVTLLGHSFGAMYASLYMSVRPENVRQAVLIEPAGLNGQIFDATFDDVFDQKLFDQASNATAWETEVFAPADHEEMDYEALALLRNGNLLQYFCDPGSPPELPVWRVGAYFDYFRNKKLRSGGGFSFDYASGLAGFTDEVLILGSECSALGADFQRTHNQPLFPNATVVEIPGVGHRMFVEDFDAVLAAVRAYLVP
jgi:proline iminopeptidase